MQYVIRKYLFAFQSLIFLFLSLSFIVTNGNYECIDSICTLSIGNWHLHDALWHISLAKLGFTSWPPLNPYMAGETLKGYNYLLDIILMGLLKLGLSPFLSFFKILPVLACTLYVWSVYRFSWHKNNSWLRANLTAFFLYFGNSFSYILTLYQSGTFQNAALKGFPVVTSIQPATMFLNLQFSFSLSLILWIFILYKNSYFKWKKFILLGLFFTLFGFKFYGGVVALGIIVTTYIFDKLGRRQSYLTFTDLFYSLLGSILSLIFFYSLGNSSKFPFTYSPLALTHLIFEDPNLFYNHSLTLARYYLYENFAGFSPRLFLIEISSIFLFLLINYGPRILSFIYVLKKVITKQVNSTTLTLSFAMIVTTLIPILFVQEGGWYNSMQFLYYGVWISGIIIAEMLHESIKLNKNRGIFFLVMIILLTLPNNLEQLSYINKEQTTIDSDELKAMEVLKQYPQGVVHIFNSEHKNGIVPALAEKFTYYLDTDQLMVTGASYQGNLEHMRKYSGGSITSVPAQYYLIYKHEWGIKDALMSLSSPNNFELIYDSDGIAIYNRIQRSFE